MLLFRMSEILHFKVSIANMSHCFSGTKLFFVCQDRKLKFCEVSIIKLLKISAFYLDKQKSFVRKSKVRHHFRVGY